ncbi:MAG: UDP-N-acetylmuramoylalanine--D-glutamate ligase [Rhodothalassiaceae bacterium]|nr:MAG: UDP-N-acetylmuramoylalanine--D-glutamate ligase [Rhodothalassiaceae bacterium]
MMAAVAEGPEEMAAGGLPLPHFARPVGILGLARTGRAARAALLAVGNRVLVHDDRAEALADIPGDERLAEEAVAGLARLLVSPGVPITGPNAHPLAVRAREAGVPIIGDLDLFTLAEPGLAAHRTVGITGTNGKSTTTALVAHVVEAAGRPAAAAGNIGRPILSLAPLEAGGVYVFELSSFQLDLAGPDAALDVGVLLNITPDHLDRHGGMAAYVAAKRRIADLARRRGGRIVLSLESAVTRTLAEELAGSDLITIAVAPDRPVAVEVTVEGRLVDHAFEAGRIVGDLSRLVRLRGRHNWENAAAAYAAARLVGLSVEEAFAGIESFPGLAHRQELVAEIAGVTFVNDSKATNLDAAARALAAFQRIHWLAGGRAKSTDLTALEPLLGQVRAAWLFGECAGDFAAALAGRVPCRRFAKLKEAVEAAAAAAEAGEVVLLSPGAASFDQYRDFEERGEDFRRIVMALAGTSPRQGKEGGQR